MDPLNKVLAILNNKGKQAAKKCDLNGAHAYFDAVAVVHTYKKSVKNNNYLELISKFKKENSSIFAQESSEECLLIFLDFILKEQGRLSKQSIFKDNLCTDNSCFCGKYSKGDVMLNCDGGCMYPGA